MSEEKKIKAWVKYKCGCEEGLWISLDNKCRDHKEPVVAYSDEQTLKATKWHNL